MDEEELAYWRALSWFKLVKVWVSLRWDDTMGWLPSSTCLSAIGMTASITRTKTIGRDKRVSLPLVVAPGCSIAGTNWLEVGLKIWQSKAFAFERDFWLSLPVPS